jgi:hypothetical protein
MQKLNSKAPTTSVAVAADHNIARDGAQKSIVPAPTVYGQKRATVGPLAAYHHGVSVDDEPNVARSFEKPVPVHPHMTDQQKAGVDPFANSPAAILKDAAKLGR